MIDVNTVDDLFNTGGNAIDHKANILDMFFHVNYFISC